MPAERVLLLSSDYYNMPNERDPGAEIVGHSVWFVNRYRDPSEKSKGFKPSKVSISEDVAEQLSKVTLPAIAELGYSSRPGAAGKATLTVTEFRIVGTVNLDKLFASPASSATA